MHDTTINNTFNNAPLDNTLSNTLSNTESPETSEVFNPIASEVLEILQSQNAPVIKPIPSLNVTKKCKFCQAEYPIVMFREQRTMSDGRKNICIACDNKRTKEYYEKNKEKRLAQVKAWMSKNKEKTKIYAEKTASRRYKNRKNKNAAQIPNNSSNTDASNVVSGIVDVSI